MPLRPKIALYEPDIPQNTAAIIRTCACLGADLEIIEPCGFLFSDKRFKRVVMDYMDERLIKFYQSSEEFFESKKGQRVILLTTKSSESYATFNFEKNDNRQRAMCWLHLDVVHAAMHAAMQFFFEFFEVEPGWSNGWMFLRRLT